MSGFYNLSLLTPDPFIMGRRFLSRLSLSMIFSVSGSVWSLYPSIVFLFFTISVALSYKYVAIKFMQLFFNARYSFLALVFCCMSATRSRESHHLLPVIFAIFFTVLSLSLFNCQLFVLGEKLGGGGVEKFLLSLMIGNFSCGVL